MEKISPPLRIALVAVMLLAVAWFVVLRPKPASNESAAPPPGIGGLSNDVKRAQSATATANAAAAAAQNSAASVDAADGAAAATKTTNTGATATKSDGASATVDKSTTSTAAEGASGTTSKGAVTKSTESATVTGANGTTVTATKKTTKAVVKPKAKAPAKPKAADPAAPLVAALRHDKAVVLLFRNSSSDSQAVADAVRAVPRQVKRVVVRVAPISQVGRYATFTEKTPISQAPTVLVIGPGRSAKVIVGYTSTAEIAEAVGDLRRAVRR